MTGQTYTDFLALLWYIKALLLGIIFSGPLSPVLLEDAFSTILSELRVSQARRNQQILYWPTGHSSGQLLVSLIVSQGETPCYQRMRLRSVAEEVCHLLHYPWRYCAKIWTLKTKLTCGPTSLI